MLALALFLLAPPAAPPPRTPYVVLESCHVGGVYFAKGSAKLDAEAWSFLRGANLVENVRRGRCKLLATADPVEAHGQAFELAQSRARVVAGALKRMGIASSRIRSEVFGDRDYFGWRNAYASRRAVVLVWEGPVIKSNEPGVPEILC